MRHAEKSRQCQYGAEINDGRRDVSPQTPHIDPLRLGGQRDDHERETGESRGGGTGDDVKVVPLRQHGCGRSSDLPCSKSTRAPDGQQEE